MSQCRACGRRLTEVMSFGDVALAGAFLSPGEIGEEKKYPLTLEMCESCWIVQTGQDVPGMFDHYHYFSSATQTMREHFRQCAAYLVERFKPKRCLEIGCNDGVLLKPIAELGVKVVGVDPAANLTQDIGLEVVNEHWDGEVASMLGKFDLIVANNVFAHIPHINDALDGVRRALSGDGTFVVEVNRLDSMVMDGQYDWVYHEHCFYWSLPAFEKVLARNGLKIFDCQRLPTHAGSIRYYICKDGRSETRRVEQQRSTDMWAGVLGIDRMRRFADEAKAHSVAFRELVKQFKRVVGYGACGRTNTMLQYCDLSSEDIDYLIDDAPAKNGLYTPGTHIPIYRNGEKPLDESEALIVFAWSFLHEILPKIGAYKGRLFIPLPAIYEHKTRVAA